MILLVTLFFKIKWLSYLTLLKASNMMPTLRCASKNTQRKAIVSRVISPRMRSDVR